MIVIWDITDPTAPHAYDNVLNPGSGPVQTVAVSPDGRLLVSGQGDATTTVWDIEKPDAPEHVAVLSGFPGPIGDVEFNPDGDVLAVASGSSTQLWDLSNAAKPALVATSITANAGEIRSMAFRPDGHILATASQSGAVQLWETDIQRANQLICGRSTHIISEGQWNEYLPDRSYDPPCPRQNHATPPAEADGAVASWKRCK
jgi:WD40 repeat protein